MAKKIIGTIDDWDRLQESLAEVISRGWRQSAIAANLPPGSNERKTADRISKEIEQEEDRLREKIGGLSRHLHVELKARR